MKNMVVYIHGKGGSAEEAKRYTPLFAGYDVVGFDYRAHYPWEAREEFPAFFEGQKRGYDSVTIIANSIGAYFAMSALTEAYVDKALFISPIVNMEKLITDMMAWSNVTEERLRREKEISTDFGEKLSWEYLCYVRRNPIIAYGDERGVAMVPYGRTDEIGR